MPSLHLHFKVLAPPVILPQAMFLQAQELFRDAAGIDLVLISTETLTIGELEDLEIGTCRASDMTAEQVALFQQRGDGNGGAIAATDIVVYFVRTMVPPVSGCAAHPPGSPGCVIAQDAALYTLAHELGHVLGLKHVPNSDRLMSEWGTANITNLPPDLSTAEVNKMLSSSLVIQP